MQKTIFSHQLDQQEKLITNMQTSGTGVSEDRIITLEKKVREIEALASGLINEMLDLRSNFRIMSRKTGEHRRQEPEVGPIARESASPVPADPSNEMSFPSLLSAAP